jgi:thiamine biosynthesis protein ThiC
MSRGTFFESTCQNYMLTTCVINKEDIPKYEMVKREVLTSPEAILKRRHDIDRAMILGNNEHQKVKISFGTTGGTMLVETTVWEVTQNYLILKANTYIPVHCVYSIEFFE